MKSLLLLSVLFVASVSFAAKPVVVKCWVPGETETQDTVYLKMKNGRITMWDKKYVARPDAKSIFGLFSEPIDNGPIESLSFGKYKNGYVFVRVVTTADEVIVGIAPGLKTGFYRYNDLGSGNGNDKIDLTCAKDS